jgi:putative ABC transport system permease protein
MILISKGASMKKLQKNRINLFKKINTLLKDIGKISKYILLISIYSLFLGVKKIATKLKFLTFIQTFLNRIILILDPHNPDKISQIELINLAIKNMTSKKNRSFVTIGGMTVGIAGIVFLVSIGYGLQALVIDRVARLDEMRQTDVSILPGSNLFLDDEVLSSFQNISSVEYALPQIAVVGKVNYNNSMTDMAVYGVTSQYLEQSAIAPVTGILFNNNDLTTSIKAEKESIDLSTEQSTPLPDSIITGELVEVEGESDIEESLEITKVQFPEAIKDREAVVNRSFLRVLDIDETEALGETFSVYFVSTNKSISGDQNRIESTSIDYKIIGVTPDDITPLFYVPFIHLRVLGINNYSQVKVVVDKDQNLESVRSEIEAKGYSTDSVVDTVAQINGLFSTARTALALLGTVALFVAALGMFNTLTVSLLERTREIGLLKAIGMESDEIRDLFLAESMIMGSLGGILGLTIGLVVGKVIELILSIYALINGVGTITIVNMPILFAIFIILLSFFVGVITGIYPARRATKISALNALRYE